MLRTWFEILWISFRLGCTSFGGPIAHLGYFRDEYVHRRKWLDDKTYADLVALCQFLPGPASSQVGIGIGIMRAGLVGGVLAFLGFTLPSVIVLVLFAGLLQGLDLQSLGWIHGLKIVAVVIVTHAILGMGKNLAPDRARASVAILVAILSLLWATALSQVLLILAAGLIGMLFFQKLTTSDQGQFVFSLNRKAGVFAIILFFGLLFGLPIIRELSSLHWLAVFDSFYRAGALVFGGGHVVLPLLEREVVSLGWVTKEQFLAGYGLTQAVPGPLFTFASYLGAVMGGWFGAVVATIAIFLPAFLLVIGTLPFWNNVRKYKNIRAALIGVNAAVVGILLAALYDPIWTSTILRPVDFALASFLFLLLTFWKCPPWVVVVVGALGGLLLV